MRNVAECLKRAEARAAGVLPPSDNAQDYNNYNLAKAKNNKPVLEDSSPPRRRLNYNDYNALKERIHSDELYLLAQTWGWSDRSLCLTCVEESENLVRRCILKVKGIQDRFFRESEPIAPQRGKYLRKVIRTEAEKRGPRYAVS